MKNIIFVTISMGGGGTERIISILANHLSSIGYGVTIMMIAGNEIAYPIDSNVRIISVGENSGRKLIPRIKRIIRMRRILNDKNAKIIAMGTVASIFTLLANWGRNSNVIISERNNPNRMNGKPYSKKMKYFRDFLYSRAAKCVFQTDDARKYFPKIPAKKSVVIPNPIPDGLLMAYQGERQKIVVTAGRLIPEKNQQMLIDAFAIFIKSHKDYQLKIFGSGELGDSLQALIKSYHLENCVSILPFTDTLHEEIKKAMIYVSSSNGEGISNSILEAMALGIPTIATDCPIGGAKMCIQDGINGYLIPVKNVQILTERMAYIADSKDVAHRLSENAIMVRDTFSMKNIMDSWLKILN